MIFVWIITSLVIFSIIVLIHEYGHFKAARIFWVRVEEFWLWIPPRAKKLFRDKEWTLFSLNWLPLWGFVKLTWEQAHGFIIFNKNNKRLSSNELLKAIENWDDVFDKKWQHINSDTLSEIKQMLDENMADYNLARKPAWQQSIIILAWVFMNFVLSIFIFSALFFFWVQPIWINNQIETDRTIRLIPTVEQAVELGIIEKEAWIRINPIEWSIAEASWLLPNDVILSANETTLQEPQELMDIISQNAWNTLNIQVQTADWEEKNVALTPWADGKIWAYLWENIQVNTDFTYKYWLLNSVKYGTIETYNQTMLTFKALWTLLRKIIRPETKQERTEAIEQVSGPIGIVDFISGALSNWVVFLIIIWAIISINLAVFNLLPIPALDGWRFVFIVLNALVLKITGKRALWEHIEWYIHVWFFVFLILLSILIAYNDILKISAQ